MLGDPIKKKKPVYDPDQELKDSFGRNLAYDNNRPLKDVVLAAAKRGNIDPSFLLSSAWQEGLNKAVLRPDEVSEGYINASKKDKTLNDYPVDGFYNYGLDTFGNNYDKIKKFLPAGFEKNFKLYDAENEKKERIQTVAFKNNEDALVAKAAFLNYERENVNNYAKQKGITPDQRTSDYFTLASYNAGMGNARKVVDQYAQSKAQDKFIDSGLTEQQGVHKNIYPRLKRQQLAGELLGVSEMKYGGKMPKKPKKYQDGTEDPIVPIDPITGKPVQTLNNPQNAGVNVFGGVGNSPVPINPNAPANEQIFQLQPQTGQVSSTAALIDPNTDFNAISQRNLEQSNENQQDRSNAEWAASTGITAINAYFNKKNTAKSQRTDLRKAIMSETFTPTINPYAEGTGSQAIMKKGGKIPGENLGINTLGGGKSSVISSSNHSNPMIEFTGNKHTEGGIGVEYGGNVAEVEDKEVGFVGTDGGLNIFGKLKVPGTNLTFRKAAKNIAEEEEKIDGMKSKYLNILNNGNIADPYQQSANSTAKVMFKSLDKQSKEIAEKKEGLASYQSLILGLTNGESDKMEYGGKMPKMPKLEKGGEIDPEDLKRLMAALGQFESGNKYDIEGVTVTKGKYKGEKALGKYQVMPGNLKSWSKEALGRVVSKEEFLKNPDIQDQIVEHQLTVISQKHNNPADIASVWFTGRPAYSGGNAKDDLGTSGNQYVNSVLDIYSGAGGDPYPKTFKQFKGKDGTQYNSPSGLAPASFYKDPDVIRALKADQTFPKAIDDSNWGIEHQKVWDQLTDAKKNELLNKSQQTNTKVTTTSGDEYVPRYEPIGRTDQPIDTPYGQARRNPTQFTDKVNLGTGDRTRGYLSPLALEQIAPELLTVATNRRDPVTQLSYQPELKQTFDLSYQLGRNENQSSFNQVAKIAESTGNVDALSQLAAQKYSADQQYNMQEVQGNATQKLGVYGQNIDTLNDARIKNLALIADQQTKQAQATFNTRKEDIGAFTSVASKVLQNDLENKTYNAYANLFKHYGFDKKGNVTFSPDDVTQKFNAGEAQQFGMMAAQQGANAIMSGNFSRQFTKVKNDDGSQTTTETLGTNKKIQEKYNALKKQGFDDGLIGNMLRAEFPQTLNQD